MKRWYLKIGGRSLARKKKKRMMKMAKGSVFRRDL